jgi:hypothetical protein
VKLKYHLPYPYYYDAYIDYVSNGGFVDAAALDTCGPPHRFFGGSHGFSRAGFGGIGACHAAAHS